MTIRREMGAEQSEPLLKSMDLEQGAIQLRGFERTNSNQKRKADQISNCWSVRSVW